LPLKKHTVASSSGRGLFAHVILHVPEDTALLFDTYNVQRRQTIMCESNVKQLS